MLTLGKRPNLEPARNREKALALIKLAEQLDVYGARQISAKELTKKLGNQCKPLGAWLRNGLIREGMYSVDKQISYTYKPNHAFVSELRLLLGLDKTDIVLTAKEQGKSFQPCARSDAKRTGHRFYPWWSFMPKAKRRELFFSQFGSLYEYDIEVARPTVLLQVYDKLLPKHLLVSDRHKIPTWRSYVQDRNTFRRHLGDDLDVPYDTIKELLQAVTNGAWASTSVRNPFCKNLGQIKVHELMRHPLYVGLRADLNLIWQVLYPGQPKKSIGKKLYAAYEPIEDKLMEVIAHRLAKLGVDAWFVHDGFFCHQQVDKADLEKFVFDVTEFSIKLEQTKFCGEEGGGIMIYPASPDSLTPVFGLIVP